MQPVPFEQFMARALHDPQSGYYARRISAVGRRGDFTTAPMLSEAPARAIAAWAVRAMKETGCRDLIEIGPGEGKLAEGLLKHLPWHVRWRTRLHLVETSAPFAARQRKLLGKRASHHSTIQEALATCGGNAVLYSNELVDAFPVRRFQKTGDGWREMAVAFDEQKRPQESLLPPAPLPESSAFRESHPAGQQIEVHESYHRHLTEWMPGWKSGRILTIDYGAAADTLYHRRPRGTVRAYLHHQLIQGPDVYANIGHQDITADVNFTDLIQWSLPWTSGHQLMTFREFLKNAGGQDSQLLDPDGAGNAFLVLDQKR